MLNSLLDTGEGKVSNLDSRNYPEVSINEGEGGSSYHLEIKHKKCTKRGLKGEEFFQVTKMCASLKKNIFPLLELKLGYLGTSILLKNE